MMTDLKDKEVILIDGNINADALLRKMIYEEGTSDKDEGLYICNLSDIARKYKTWYEKMPRVKPFYAVKCNDDDKVLRLLADLGTGFDCASRGEIEKLLSFGVTAERIIFAHTCKPTSHIRYAATVNASLMTFDSTEEVEKIQKIYPNARLLLRIRCDSEKAFCVLGDKFGCNPDSEAPQLLLNAKNLGVNVVGISFHVGSGSYDPPIFRKAIAIARQLFDYANTLGYRMSVLNIGGGFPGDTGTDIGAFADVVNSALNELFPLVSDEKVEIIAEPGRFFVSSAYTLGVPVHSKKVIREKDGCPTYAQYYVGVGNYNSFRLVQTHKQVVSPYVLCRQLTDTEDTEKPKNTLEVVKCSIWGPTCDSLDKICDDQTFPLLNIGDVIVFPNMGAYNLTTACPFNGFPIPRVLYFAEKGMWSALKPFRTSNGRQGYFETRQNNLYKKYITSICKLKCK